MPWLPSPAKPREDPSMQDLVGVARQQLGWYVRNCVLSPAAQMLECILLERLNLLKGIPDDDENDLDLATPTKRRRLMRELRRVTRSYSTADTGGDSLEHNALFARDEFGLDGIDTEILLLVLRYERNKELENFVDEVARRLNSASKTIAALIGGDARDVHGRVLPGSALIASGVLSMSAEGTDLCGRCGLLQVSAPLRRVMFRPCNSREEWATAIFGAPL